MDNYNFDFNFIKSGGAPLVTLNSLGIAFNAVSRSMLNYPKFIDIGFDEKNCTLGIKANNDNKNMTSFKFEEKERNGWIRISCKDFVNYLSVLSGIDFITRARQFVATYDSDKQILIVVIDKEHLKDKVRVSKDK